MIAVDVVVVVLQCCVPRSQTDAGKTPDITRLQRQLEIHLISVAISYASTSLQAAYMSAILNFQNLRFMSCDLRYHAILLCSAKFP